MGVHKLGAFYPARIQHPYPVTPGQFGQAIYQVPRRFYPPLIVQAHPALCTAAPVLYPDVTQAIQIWLQG